MPSLVANNRGENLHLAEVSDHVTWKDRIVHFTWSWFSCTMSTGAIAVLLASQPFGFTGLRTIGKIFFMLDLVLFVLFCSLIVMRFVMHPAAFSKSLHHPKECFFFGAFLVSLVLIINCIEQYGVPSSGPWLVKTVEVLFWAYSAIALLAVIFQYYVIFATETLEVKEAIPGWILPAYPLIVLGPLAAVLVEDQPQQSGLNIWIGGVMFLGLGWILAFLMYTLYFTRLIVGKFPEPSLRPGMYIAVGPVCYTAQGIINLSLNARDTIPSGFLDIPDLNVGNVFRAIGVPIGIFLWGVGFWFFTVATLSILSGVRKMQFTLNCWAYIFPNVGLTLGVIAIGNALGSDGIKGVASGMSVVLVGAWILVAAANCRAVGNGTVMWPGKDEDGGDVTRREGDDVESDGTFKDDD